MVMATFPRTFPASMWRMASGTDSSGYDLSTTDHGFALQESALPFEGPDAAAEVAEPMMAEFPAGEYPHLVELMVEHAMQPGYDFGEELEFGLELILDALDAELR